MTQEGEAMNILPLGQHLDPLLPVGHCYVVQRQQPQQVLGRVTARGVGRQADGAWLLVLLHQLGKAVAVRVDKLGELGLEGGADGRGWRGINLQQWCKDKFLNSKFLKILEIFICQRSK